MSNETEGITGLEQSPDLKALIAEMDKEQLRLVVGLINLGSNSTIQSISMVTGIHPKAEQDWSIYSKKISGWLAARMNQLGM